jgi:N-acetylmuramoyl-L-alanine amidase
MRELKRIILHCSATEEGKVFDVHDIRIWHKARGWSDVGYHYVINLDGTVGIGRPIARIGAHVSGHNHDSIGVCYIGGVRNGKPSDTMNAFQYESALRLFRQLRRRYGDMTLHGHNEFANKACPSFDVRKKFKEALR